MPPALFEEVRDRYKHCAEELKNPMLFPAMVAEQLGVCDKDGNLFFSEAGRPCRNPDKAKRFRNPDDFRTDLLAEAMLGRDWKVVLGMNNSGKLFPTQEYRGQAMRAGFASEAEGAPLGPSMYGNVAAWNATISILLGAKFDYGYESAPYELADLFPVRPGVFYQGGERLIDIIGVYQPAQITGPGEEYPDNTMSALWVETSPAQKYAGKITLTKELLAIDVSGGQIMAQASQGGESIRFRENEDTISVITGQTNNWKLGMLPDTSATSYNTYGATITGPVASRTLTNNNVNPLNDPGALQKSNEYISNLYNPVTDFPMNMTMDVAIFPEPMADFANAINSSTDFRLMNQTTINQAQVPAGTFPSDMVSFANPWRGAIKRAIASRWLWRRITGSTTQPDPNLTAGLGLSGAAAYRWWRMDPSKVACRRQMWAPTSNTLNPNDWVMATQGIVAGFAWDMSYNLNVLNGYAIQQNKAA